MRVDRPPELLHGRFELDRGAGLGDEVGRVRPDDVNPQNLIVAPIGHDLHEAFSISQNLRLSCIFG